MLKTNSEWLEWGRRDPLFGVASWKTKGVDDSAPWTDEAFYKLGASDWKDFEEHWRRYGYTPGTFVEIGCGAGRITKQLALAFQHGHALDVSKDMLGYASRHIASVNIDWHETQGLTIPLGNRSVDAVFSCHVLQHLPDVDAGYDYFREAFRVLKPSGTFMVHLPIHSLPAAVSMKFAALCRLLYTALLSLLDVRSNYKRFRMKHGAAPPMHGTSYEQEPLYRALTAIGYSRVEFMTFPVVSNGSLHSFVMGTKPEN